MDEPDKNIVDLTAACILAVEEVAKVRLDFTQDTLPFLDFYLMSAREVKEEAHGLIAQMVGVYFGEVIRRNLGPARWYLPREQPENVRLEFEDIFLSFNPIGIAYEALIEEESEGFGAHLELRPADRSVVKGSLEALGATRSDDYYRFGVRFEIIDQVAHILRSRLPEAERSRTLGPDAYAHLRIDDPPESPLS